VNQFKTALGSGVMMVLTLAGTFPAIAQSVPSQSREACIQRTAEEMGVATRDINVISAGPLSAESGAVTLFMRNVKTRQTAECRVNTIDSTVLSVNLGSSNTSSNPTAQKPEYWVVSVNRTYLKSSPGIFSNTVNNDVMRGTVLRNLGCQRQQLPTWCQVELRDNPKLKGWAFTPNLKEYIANSSPSRPSNKKGETVNALADLVGARAGQAENELQLRGYEFRRSTKQADSSFSYWLEENTGSCVAIRTTDGRYGAIVYTADKDCNRR
jgi:hypothetical protein